MRDWSVAGPDEGRPAHAPTSARFPRWPTITAAVAIPAIIAAAFLVPKHAAVRHHAAAAPPAAAAPQAALHDFALADTVTGPVGQPIPVALTTAAAALPAALQAPAAGNAAAGAVSPLAADGIPRTALDAYMNAATLADAEYADCKLPWPLLAGIGRVESDHGRFGGAVLYSDGTSSNKILGIPLDGSRSATITDTDNGRLDGDPVYDRAVGPMQFIPSTWASYGADGNGDGKADPFNIFDAALAAAHYLCVAGGDLSTAAGQARAVLAYNHSSAYLAEVTALERTYASGAGVVVPIGPAPPPPTSTPTLPPVDPGPPLGRPQPHPPTHSASPSSSTAHSPGPSTSAAPSEEPTSSSEPTPTPSSSDPSTSSAPSCTPSPSPTSTDSTGPRSPLPSPSFTFEGTVPSSSAPASPELVSPEPAIDSAGLSAAASASESSSPTPSPTPSC
jgi:membrane-bound lytic murein transglycosylase B